MFPRLNYRFIALLFVAVALVVAIAHGIHTVQMARHEASFLREARRVREEGRLLDALAHYRRYTLVVPDDVEALTEFGHLLRDIGSKEQAYLILSRSLGLDPSQNELRLELADLAISMYRFNDALDHLNSLISKSENDPELLERVAVCLGGSGKYKEAASALEKAIKADPNNLDLYLRLANLHNLALNNYSDARAVLDDMVAKNAEEPRAYVARGHWIMSVIAGTSSDQQSRSGGAIRALESHRYDEVQSDVKKALQLAPSSVDANLLAAELALTQMELDKAVEYAMRAKRIAPNEPYPVRLLVRIASLKGDLDEAVTLSKEGIKTWPNDFQLQWMLANLLIDQAKVNEAQPLIERIRALSPDVSLVALLEARILAVEGKWLEAAKLVEENRARLVNWPAIASRADFLLGHCYQQLARPDQELNAYRRALDVDPTSRDLRLAVANALRNAKKFDEAFEEYQAIVVGGLGGEDGGKGEVPLEAIVNYFRLLVREESLKAKGNSLDRVVDELNRLQTKNNDNKFLTILRAELLVAQGKLEEATEIIQKVQSENPEQFEFFSAAVLLGCQGEDWDAVDQLLVEGKDRFRDDQRFWMLLGKAAMLRYGTEAGPHIREIADDEQLKAIESYSSVVNYLASLAFWIQDTELTSELGQRVVEAEPNQLAVRLLLLESAFREKDLEAVGPLLAEVEAIDGRHATWSYGEAMRLVLALEKGEIESEDKAILRAFAHLADAQKYRPGWGRALTFEAQLLERQGQDDLALSKYQDAISLGERDPFALQRATALLFERGRFAEVDRLLGQLNENGSSVSTELLHVGAEAAIQMGNLGRALQLAQDFAEKSDDSKDHVWLAQLLVLLEKPTEAEAELKRAIELAPSKPEPWLGMVGIYARQDKRELAFEAMQEGRENLGEAEQDLFQGNCYEILGERGKAEASYLAATTNLPDSIEAQLALVNFYLRNSRRLEAQRELQVLLDRKDLKADKASVARRNLAIQLAMDADAEKTKQALALLDKNEQQIGKAKEDQIARASILASLPSEESRLKAIDILEEVGLANLSLDEQFLLAKLYAKYGEPQKAAQLLRQLTVRSSADPKYLRTYVAALIQIGEESEAILWLEKLQETSPNHFATADLEARVLFAEEKYDQIPVLLDKWVNQDAPVEEKGVAGRTVQLEWAASRLDSFASLLTKEEQAGTADDLRAQATALRNGLEEPQLKLERARGLAAQKQFSEAVALLKDVPGTVSARDFGRSMAFIVARGPDDKSLQEINQLLTDAQKKYSEEVDVISVLADVLLLQGDFNKSEELYREILKGDPKNVHALNNCALAMSYAGEHADEAVQMANEAIKNAGALPPLLDTRGMAYMAAGNNESAIDDFKKAIADSPRPEYYFHLALAQKAAGLPEESKASFGVIKYRKFNELQLHTSEKSAYEGLATVE